MIQAIALLLLGVLLGTAAVLLRKKLGKAWTASLLAAGLLVALCGGVFTYEQLEQRRQSRESVYLGLAYLERGQAESASFYLKKAGTAQDYVSSLARCLLEKLRENELTARVDLDIAGGFAKTQEQLDLLDILRGMDIHNSEQLALVTGRLQDMLRLSEKRREALSVYVQAENGQYLDSEAAAAAGLDDTAASRLSVSAMLGNGSFEQAVSAAAALADRHPSADNRLLLAEAVAESAYRGAVLSDRVFAIQTEDGEKLDESEARVREKLRERQEKLQTELLALDMSISGATDPKRLEELGARRLELTEQAQALQKRSDKLYVYRAFSAIADIHSLEARLVRARLYFALQDYDQAVDALLGAAKSLDARLTPDQSVADSLRVVEQAYNGAGAFYESPEFRDAVTGLLSAPFPDLINIYRSPLTQDFAQRVVSDQKTYGRSLAISGFDTSEYPTVHVSLSGREDVLRQVAKGQGVTARDTRQDVQYTADLQAGAALDLCVVVDRSGSMGGAPMANLKEALSEFIHNARTGTAMSLVAFDNSASCLTELTTDQAALLNTVNGLGTGGGTEITAGIRAGIQALEAAASSRIMLLMTDGQSSVDFNIVDEAAHMGITIHTIGFGSVNDSLLEEIAERTGGQYVKADSSSELSNVYDGLQQIIGNLLVLTYTAKDADEPRYFYLRVDDTSVRRDYALTEPEDTGPWAYVCTPALLQPEAAQQPNNSLYLTLRGERLAQVVGATVGGQTAQVSDQREDSLRLTVPAALAEGWQTIVLRMEDGTERRFDQLLLVGAVENYRDLRLGSLLIASAQGVRAEGSLVLAGTMGLRLSTEERSTLQMTVNGTLRLPWTLPAPAEGEPPQTVGVDLGDNGTITGWGLVTLDPGDGAYDSRAPRTVAKGALQIECGLDQSRLMWTEEAAS